MGTSIKEFKRDKSLLTTLRSLALVHGLHDHEDAPEDAPKPTDEGEKQLAHSNEDVCTVSSDGPADNHPKAED